MAISVAVVAVMAWHEPIPWKSPCVDPAVIANWSKIRTQLAKVLPSSDSKIGKAKKDQVYKLLGKSWNLPTKPNIDIYHQVFDIVGADYMQFAIDEILNRYWAKYPC
ncbi:hypothetical protein IWW38_002416, partial [Coemansia aciculifera]